VTMAVFGIEANEPIYVGLAAGLVVFVVGSLASRPTAPDVLAEWDRRSSGTPAATPVA
jgi:solute:Na+ symporter, SSS family